MSLRETGRLPLWLSLAAAGLLALTFVNPAANLKRDTFRYIFVFDITQSMNVVDAGTPPRSRLDYAKAAARDALPGLPCGSEAGIALFTEHRTFLLFAPVEICAHYGEITAQIGIIDWRMAWAARSEVAKGLFSSFDVARQLDAPAHIVFFTDGHEAPPLHPEYQPRMTKTRVGEIKGLFVGVGANELSPIPKFGREGEFAGNWGAGEVLQVDTVTLGRISGSDSGERFAGVDSENIDERIAAGVEHLSSLRESYLRRLARRAGVGYHRLADGGGLASRLRADEFAERSPKRTDLRWLLGLIALVFTVLTYFRYTRACAVAKA
ncbi:MAG: hypothetical protein ACR2RB_17135 [Gammaproteobacteria bacterium]